LINQVSYVTSKHSKVIAIEKIRNQEWWDVTVKKNHNYYAEGAVHHNSGKSEACYIDAIMKLEQRPNWNSNDRDPYLVAMILPTDQMLKKLAWPKFFQFVKGCGIDPKKTFNKTENRFIWPNESIIYGISAEKIQRIEGLKINHILIDEAFQMHEDVLYESLARVSDSKGSLVISGSLGTNIINPKKHWVYKTFIENEFDDCEVIQWKTIDNPYFPKDELERLRGSLDPRTYRALFEIDWDIVGENIVFNDFDEANVIQGTHYNPEFETSVSIDWGWAHPMCALFFQYDRKNDLIYVIDEIYGSNITLEKFYDRIKAKPYQIQNWYCDSAGGQTRELSGISNIQWFAMPPRNIHFKYRKARILHGITLIRTRIKNGLGQRKLLIDARCKNLIDEIKNYHFKEVNGQIDSEIPDQTGEDAISALRYYMLNRHDNLNTPFLAKSTSQFGDWKFQ
jgi:PBSX family phage terminase large subunit